MRHDPGGFAEAKQTESRDNEDSQEECKNRRHEAMAQAVSEVWQTGALAQKKLRLQPRFQREAALTKSPVREKGSDPFETLYKANNTEAG